MVPFCSQMFLFDFSSQETAQIMEPLILFFLLLRRFMKLLKMLTMMIILIMLTMLIVLTMLIMTIVTLLAMVTLLKMMTMMKSEFLNWTLTTISNLRRWQRLKKTNQSMFICDCPRQRTIFTQRKKYKSKTPGMLLSIHRNSYHSFHSASSFCLYEAHDNNSLSF